MTTTIVDLVVTSEDRDLVLREIGLLRDAIYQTDSEALETALRSMVRADVSRLLKQTFKAVPETEMSVDEYRNYKIQVLNGLEKALVGLPVVGVSLAFHPTEELLDWMVNYFNQEIGQRLILDVDYNPTVVGGVRVVFGGNYQDWTLGKTFIEVLDNKLGEAIRRAME